MAAQQTIETWLGPRWVLTILGWSGSAWLLSAAINALVMAALGVTPSAWLAASLAVLVALYAAAVVPALPGRMGIFQSACVVALLPFGVDVDSALACALALYVVVYAPPLLLSAVSLVLVHGRAEPG